MDTTKFIGFIHGVSHPLIYHLSSLVFRHLFSWYFLPTVSPSGRWLTNKKAWELSPIIAFEALDCPLSNDKTIVPRFMIAYNSPFWKIYNKHERRSYFPFILER